MHRTIVRSFKMNIKIGSFQHQTAFYDDNCSSPVNKYTFQDNQYKQLHTSTIHDHNNSYAGMYIHLLQSVISTKAVNTNLTLIKNGSREVSKSTKNIFLNQRRENLFRSSNQAPNSVNKKVIIQRDGEGLKTGRQDWNVKTRCITDKVVYMQSCHWIWMYKCV